MCALMSQEPSVPAAERATAPAQATAAVAQPCERRHHSRRECIRLARELAVQR
jgi:hypothetical protein